MTSIHFLFHFYKPGGHRSSRDSIRIITVASEKTPELRNLLKSADLSGVQVDVLGLGVPYPGHEVKLRLYLEYLENIEDEDELVLGMDAYDTLITPSVLEAPSLFK